MSLPNPPNNLERNVLIVDYDFGNIRSVANALESLGVNVLISRERGDFQKADCIILPGVGAFADGMANLEKFDLVGPLSEWVLERKKPFLGICVGMQLLVETGFENGEHKGLGWLKGDVVRFEVDKTHELKVPHVGWNDVTLTRPDTIMGEAGQNHSYYFVHSYHLRCADRGVILGTCEYGVQFPAIIRKENILATQFHPEKSQRHGLALLRSFLEQSDCNAVPATGQEVSTC